MDDHHKGLDAAIAALVKQERQEASDIERALWDPKTWIIELDVDDDEVKVVVFDNDYTAYRTIGLLQMVRDQCRKAGPEDIDKLDLIAETLEKCVTVLDHHLGIGPAPRA